MTRGFTKNALCIAIAFQLGLLLFGPVIVPFVFPWTEINCEHQDINIKTGEARYSRYIWFIKVSERVVPTPLSIALNGETVDINTVTPWHRANTRSPGVSYSPHYHFHSALQQAFIMKDVFALRAATPKSRREIAAHILALWQETGSDYAAGMYIAELQEGSRGQER